METDFEELAFTMDMAALVIKYIALEVHLHMVVLVQVAFNTVKVILDKELTSEVNQDKVRSLEVVVQDAIVILGMVDTFSN